MIGARYLAAGIGTHKVIAGHIAAGDLGRLVEKFAPEGG